MTAGDQEVEALWPYMAHTKFFEARPWVPLLCQGGRDGKEVEWKSGPTPSTCEWVRWPQEEGDLQTPRKAVECSFVGDA